MRKKERNKNIFMGSCLIFVIISIFLFYAEAQEIVYTSNKDGTYDIWTLSNDGTKNNLSKVSHDPYSLYNEDEPNWSPDGNRVVFRSNKTGVYNIWIMDADGSNDYNLTNSTLAELDPFWSQDGSKILFARNTVYSHYQGNSGSCPYWEIYVYDLMGDIENRLTYNNYREMKPVMSPDGNFIVYTKSENPNDSCNATNIWIMNADGSEQALLIGEPGLYEWVRDWGKINNKILFNKQFGCGSLCCDEVTYIEADDPSILYRVTVDNYGDWPTTFSPDGQKILFTSYRSGNPDVWETDLGGTYFINLTEEAAHDDFADWKMGVLEVDIDIKPGSYPNSINLKSKGNVPVAIFSTNEFDATTIDPSTITLAEAPVIIKKNGKLMASFEDVNGDGLQDMVVHIDTTALQLSLGDTEAVLDGETFNGKKIRGVDTVRIVK